MEVSRAFLLSGGWGPWAGVRGVTGVGVGAAGRGEGDPKLETDW